MNDSLRRDDMKEINRILGVEDVKVAKTKKKLVNRYQIMYTVGSVRKASRKLYQYKTACKLVARLNKMTKGYADAYASVMRVYE